MTADLVAGAVVDSKGRIVIDGQIRKMADIKEGDQLRVAFNVGPQNLWMISITKPKKNSERGL
jgi:bifunctional DNA-binding transcriptional regulator/antitoxin component of YhaV-PrlF toxin-antitoxin module